jgi:hypothetical protein
MSPTELAQLVALKECTFSAGTKMTTFKRVELGGKP